MKSKKLKFTAIAATLCLPLGAYADCGEDHAHKADKHDSTTASADADHMHTPHMGADRITENPEPGFHADRDSEDSYALREESESNREWRSSSDENRMRLTSSDVKKVEESELRNKLTADDLVGKTVVDRDGQEIGEVRAIALTSLDQKQSRSSSDFGRSDSMGSSSERSSQQAEVHVYIEAQDGDSLFEVPMSELSFNDQQEELRLDVAQSDLESLTSSTVAITD